ncbi:MAG: hypothetical protein IKB34_06985 [Clostridia bacterium]|nr:hypothetical protein [Clostridia bacterium]
MNFDPKSFTPNGGNNRDNKSFNGWGVAVFLILLGVIASVIVTVIGAGSINLSQRVNGDVALRKTAKTFFPDSIQLIEDCSRGSEVTVMGNLGNDIIPAVGTKNLDFFLNGSFDPRDERMLLEGSVEAGAGKIEGKLWMNGEKALFNGGNLTSEKWYKVNFKEIESAIDQSPLAPDSGSDYAMNEETRDLLIRLADAVSSSYESDEDNALTEAIERISEEIVSEISFSFEIVLDDTYPGKYKIVKHYYLSEDFVSVLIRAIRAEWQAGSDARVYIEKMIREGYTPESGYRTADEYVSAVTESLEKTLDTYENTTVKFEYTSVESSKYLHSVDMKLVLVDEKGNSVESMEYTWRLTVEENKITGNLNARVGAYKIALELLKERTDEALQGSFRLSIGDVHYSILELKLSYTERAGGEMSDYSIGFYSYGTELVSAAGNYQFSDGEAFFRLTSFKYDLYGEASWEMKSTVLDLFVTPTKGDVPNAPRVNGSLFDMSEEELDAAFSDFNPMLEAEVEAINSEYADKVLLKDYSFEYKSSLNRPGDGTKHIAYDSVTGKTYFLQGKNLVSYSEADGFKNAITFTFDVKAFQVAKGKATVMPLVSQDNSVWIYDLATGTFDYDIRLPQTAGATKNTLGSAVLYEDKVYFTYSFLISSPVYVYDTHTKTTRTLSEGIKLGIVLDDRSGTMLVTENGVTPAKSMLFRLDTEEIIGSLEVNGVSPTVLCYEGYYWVDSAAISVDGKNILRAPDNLTIKNIAFDNGNIAVYSEDTKSLQTLVFINNRLHFVLQNKSLLAGKDNGDGTYTFLFRDSDGFGFITYESKWTGGYTLNFGG